MMTDRRITCRYLAPHMQHNPLRPSITVGLLSSGALHVKSSVCRPIPVLAEFS
uniref:Uncharacterized protein n=1 Tax=Siphoviridae sp. ctXQ014 TaxID=2825542 RepID=A0A8S5PP54_9CAUD|nr:MAG TPA: hypothetical protein [Siphoviridae sp. ctXQ014]